MIIQPLNEQHLSVMMAIEVSANAFPWSEQNMSSCFGARYFHFGMFDQAQLVGFYIAEMAGPDFTLMDIGVNPQYQGKGIASQLMAHLVEQSQTRGAENIFLEVRASNQAAIHLYNKVGFCEMGIRKNYYPAATGNEDAILMGLPFNPFAM
jgi:ribosomal-protein-alanine N-acetyltransferase